MNRFEKDSHFESRLKEYGIEWMSGHKQYMKLYSGSPSHIEASEQEILGIIVTELLKRNGDICIEGLYRVVSGKIDVIGDTEIQTLQEAVNSIDWSK